MLQFDNQKEQIRVLQISGRDTSDSIIQCKLSIVSLQDQPKYHALSYVWGDPRQTTTILVDGQPYPATTNLEQGLRQLRDMKLMDPIWIDAICIRQDDNEEKAHQISLMKDIYSKAHSTLIWLGIEDNDSHQAFKLLRKWEHYWNSGEQLTKDAIVNSRQISHSSDATLLVELDDYKALMKYYFTTHLNQEIEQQFEPSEFVALKELFRRPYWKRVWIMQEFAVSCKATLICGEDQLDMKSFHTAFNFLLVHNTLGLSETLNINHLDAIQSVLHGEILRLIDLNRIYTSDDPTYNSFWDMVLLSATHLASDPRDRVYALLGLVKEKDVVIDIDYNKPIVQVYIDAFLQLLHQESIGTQCLALCSKYSDSDGHWHSDLPSWVCNFSRKGDFLETKQFYDWKDSEFSADVVVSGKTLAVNIIYCTKVQDKRTWTDSMPTTFQLWLDMIYSWDIPHPSSFPLLQIFFRTLILDDSGYGMHQPGFRSKPHEDLFFKMAIDYMFCLGRTAEHEHGKFDDTRSLPYRQLSSFLSKYLDLINRLRFYKLWITLPHHITYLALWLISSKANLKKLTLLSILEQFCDTSNKGLGMDWLNIENLFSDSRSATFRGGHLQSSAGRRDSFFITPDGYMGLGPAILKEDDVICMVPGCSYPLAIRKIQLDITLSETSDTHYHLIGPCYVYGMMNGEPAGHLTAHERLQRIELV